MDQLKDYLKVAIKYRFWIAVGLSAFLPMLAYLVAVGSIQDDAKKQVGTIESADKGVKSITDGVPNKPFQEAVKNQTELLDKEVKHTWRELYKRQAPLLTWPERVAPKFQGWGRRWPEKVDPYEIRNAIDAYVRDYPEYVTEVYKSFAPFDFEKGTGVVAAPPEPALLQPADFDQNSLPSLGQVWSAQEKLWLQRTIFDVVKTVNKDAKNWDEAVVKQINLLEVATDGAQDTQSLAAKEVLQDAEELQPGGAAADAAKTAAGTGGNTATSSGGSTTIRYIKPANAPYRIYPIYLDVMIDQRHLPDLILALQNHPMAIQVREFKWEKPTTRVKKPVKGEAPASTASSGSTYGGKGGGMGLFNSGGYGPSRGGPAARYGGSDMMKGFREGGGGPETSRGSTDLRNKKAEPKKKKVELPKVETFDPYYNVIRVEIYGQARFYDTPPAATPEEASESQSAAGAKTDAPKKDDSEREPSKVEKADDKAEKPGSTEGKSEKEPAKADQKAEKDQTDEKAATDKPAADKPEDGADKNAPAESDDATKKADAEKDKDKDKDDAAKSAEPKSTPEKTKDKP